MHFNNSPLFSIFFDRQDKLIKKSIFACENSFFCLLFKLILRMLLALRLCMALENDIPVTPENRATKKCIGVSDLCVYTIYIFETQEGGFIIFKAQGTVNYFRYDKIQVQVLQNDNNRCRLVRYSLY